MPTLHKYREFGNDYHLRLLTEREIFFSPPADFDDPKDCAIEVRTGSDPDEDFVASWRENHVSSHSEVSREEVRKATAQFISDDKPISDERVRELISERVGVLSLSRNPVSPRLWREYAQSHTGFCVGLDWKELNKWCDEQSDGTITFAPLPVEYPEQRPTLNLSVDPAEDVAEKAVTVKRSGYSWEQEYRVIGFGASGEAKTIPDRVFESVAVGKGASRENMRTVKNAAEGLDTVVRILKAVSIGTAEVRFREIDRI